MHKPNFNKPTLQERRVLLTRPHVKSQALALRLKDEGIFSHSYPLINIQIEKALPNSNFYNADIIIAISDNAVHFSNQQIEYWPKSAMYLAVGNATQRVFKGLGIDAQIPDVSTSEGLLNLSCLTNVKHKNISIIRGVGGRELLAKSLIERGANVNYLEVYTRQLIELKSKKCIRKWQQDEINTIVVTSGEMLEHIYTNTNDKDLIWLQNMWLVVPSHRIVIIAKRLGAKNVSMSSGADNTSILKILLNE